jgi:hypothetical protein
MPLFAYGVEAVVCLLALDGPKDLDVLDKLRDHGVVLLGEARYAVHQIHISLQRAMF